MTIEDREDKNKVNLSVGIQDLVEIVSKSGNRLSLSQASSTGYSSIEAEELKKAWFNHLLISLEKLHKAIEDVRRTDIPDLKKELNKALEKVETELKGSINKEVEGLKGNINKEVERLDKAVVKNETSVADVLKTITPLNEKVTELRTKMALIGVLAGTIGSLIFLIIKVLLTS